MSVMSPLFDYFANRMTYKKTVYCTSNAVCGDHVLPLCPTECERQNLSLSDFNEIRYGRIFKKCHRAGL